MTWKSLIRLPGKRPWDGDQLFVSIREVEEKIGSNYGSQSPDKKGDAEMSKRKEMAAMPRSLAEIQERHDAERWKALSKGGFPPSQEFLDRAYLLMLVAKSQ